MLSNNCLSLKTLNSLISQPTASFPASDKQPDAYSLEDILHQHDISMSTGRVTSQVPCSQSMFSRLASPQSTSDQEHKTCPHLLHCNSAEKLADDNSIAALDIFPVNQTADVASENTAPAAPNMHFSQSTAFVTPSFFSSPIPSNLINTIPALESHLSDLAIRKAVKTQMEDAVSNETVTNATRTYPFGSSVDFGSTSHVNSKLISPTGEGPGYRMHKAFRRRPSSPGLILSGPVGEDSRLTHSGGSKPRLRRLPRRTFSDSTHSDNFPTPLFSEHPCPVQPLHHQQHSSQKYRIRRHPALSVSPNCLANTLSPHLSSSASPSSPLLPHCDRQSNSSLSLISRQPCTLSVTPLSPVKDLHSPEKRSSKCVISSFKETTPYPLKEVQKTAISMSDANDSSSSNITVCSQSKTVHCSSSISPSVSSFPFQTVVASIRPATSRPSPCFTRAQSAGLLPFGKAQLAGLESDDDVDCEPSSLSFRSSVDTNSVVAAIPDGELAATSLRFHKNPTSRAISIGGQ
ncbi:unnamed protein product, partial [Protopolystoma xenopodis]